MLKWAFIRSDGTNEFVSPANSGREAVAMAEDEWSRLTSSERKKMQFFHVGLYNLDKKGNYAELEDGSIDADGRTVIFDKLNEISGNRVKNIVDMSGMNLATFSRKFGVPYRSLQHWVGGDREAPDYVLDMLEKVVWETIEN